MRCAGVCRAASADRKLRMALPKSQPLAGLTPPIRCVFSSGLAWPSTGRASDRLPIEAPNHNPVMNYLCTPHLMLEQDTNGGFTMGRSLGRGHYAGPTKSQKRSRWQSVDPDTTTVIRRLRKYMAVHDIDVATLARQCGVGRTAMYQALSPLRAGRGPMRITFIRMLARTCGLSLHDLLDP